MKQKVTKENIKKIKPGDTVIVDDCSSKTCFFREECIGKELRVATSKPYHSDSTLMRWEVDFNITKGSERDVCCFIEPWVDEKGPYWWIPEPDRSET